MEKTSLVIEDCTPDREKIEGLLEARGISYDVATDEVTAGRLLAKRAYAFVFLDLRLGSDRNAGIFILDLMQQKGLSIPTAIVSRFASEREAKSLPGTYPFVVQVIDKNDLPYMIPVLGRLLDSAVGRGNGQDATSREGSDNVRAPARPAGWRVVGYTAGLSAVLLLGVGVLLYLVRSFGANPPWVNAAVSLFFVIVLAGAIALLGRESVREAVAACFELLRGRGNTRSD